MRDHVDAELIVPIPTIAAAIDVDGAICNQLAGKLVRRAGHPDASIVGITPRKGNPKFELMVSGHSMLFGSVALPNGELVLGTSNNNDDCVLLEMIQGLARSAKVSEAKSTNDASTTNRNTLGRRDRMRQIIEEKRLTGDSPSDEDLKYLWQTKQYEVGAEWLEETFRLTGTVGVAAKSSKWWRKATLPKNSLRVTASVETDTKHTMARILWTTRGAAYSDLQEFNDAIRCGMKAVNLGPEDYFPCNMLGRAYGLKGDFKESSSWFHRALELERDKKGDTAPIIEVAKSLRGALNEVSEDQRSAWLEHLESFDRELYELASESNSKRRESDSRFDDVPF